jgi:hypothetical protein
MRLSAMALGVALLISPAMGAPTPASGDSCYYYRGQHYSYYRHGHYYRYRWHGHYYNHRYRCVGGWCYR